TYALSSESVPAEERIRLPAHPVLMALEGVRRKYGLERLVERVGPTETVLHPTAKLQAIVEEASLSAVQRAIALLFDGQHPIGRIHRVLGEPAQLALTEANVYGLAWTLLCAGALSTRPTVPAAEERLPEIEWIPTERRQLERGSVDSDRDSKV